ncbi:MAG: Na+/H+ antiporter NhaC [Tissierellaceae bacterium]|nr:Na+/H+ antiporter NhaC [Tissierellaceae bacterium]
MEENKNPGFGVSLFILMSLIVIMAISLIWLNIPVHVAMAVSMAIAIGALMLKGHIKWDTIEGAINEGGRLAMQTLLILLIIGMTMGAWMASGTVPGLIYYGLKLINPNMFLVTAFLICCVVGVATGSSWSTVGTVGVALIGVANGLGINLAMAAGAIVSGSCFGDKMSPLSDTANLSSAIAEGNVFDHIKSMLYTTTPAFIISLILYIILGQQSSAQTVELSSITATTDAIASAFNLNLLIWLPAIVIVVLAIKEVPALITLFSSAVCAAVIAMIIQGYSLAEITTFMDTGFISKTGIESVDSLLTRGGLQNMAYTCLLTLIVMPYGTILERTGVLSSFLDKLKALTKSVSALIISTVLTGIFMNIVTASQYMSICITGKIYVQSYKDKDLLPQVLSRTLEDSGTLTSPLVPWNLCGLFFTGALGIGPTLYAPYAFVNWVSPCIAMLFGVIGFAVWKTGEKKSVRTYRALTEIEEDRLNKYKQNITN